MNESKLDIYEKYAEWQPKTGNKICNFIKRTCKLLGNNRNDITIIEPGCGVGIRSKYFIKNLEFKKYIGLDNEKLEGCLDKFQKNILKNTKRKNIVALKEDFLEWNPEKVLGNKPKVVVILSFFLHWLGVKWMEGVKKTLQLSPICIVVINGGMPIFPTDGVIQYLLPYCKFDNNFTKWLGFLFKIRQTLEEKSINLDKGLSAQDYVSTRQPLLSAGYSLQGFKVFQEKKEFDRDFIEKFYKADPLNFLPNQQRLRNDIANDLKKQKDLPKKIKLRYLNYVTVFAKPTTD